MHYTAESVFFRRNEMLAAGAGKAKIIQELAPMCTGWPYMFGAWGAECTLPNRRKYAGQCEAKHPDYAAKIINACPVLSGKQPACDGCKWVDCLCFDCRGYTNWLNKQVGLQLYGSTVSTQWETDSNWVAKGDIDTLPKNLVACIFRPSHTGMYLGNENISHCSGTVKEETLPGSPKWERWGISAGLYSLKELRKAGLDVDESKNIPTIRKGAEGSLVATLQQLLFEEGYKISIDSIFGSKTENAVKDFQQKNDLKPDGIVGPKTWNKLGYDPSPSDDHNDADENQEDQEVLMIPKDTVTSIAMQLNKCAEEMKKLVETLLASTF